MCFPRPVGRWRAILFVGSADSDVDLLARGGQGNYWHVVCGDVAGFALALEKVAECIVHEYRLLDARLAHRRVFWTILVLRAEGANDASCVCRPPRGR